MNCDCDNAGQSTGKIICFLLVCSAIHPIASHTILMFSSLMSLFSSGDSGSSVGVLQDDIEEIYDSNFGEHFRRLRQGDSDIRGGEIRGVDSDRRQGGGLTDTKLSATAKNETGRRAVLHDDAGSTSNSKGTCVSPARLRVPVHEKEDALLAEGRTLDSMKKKPNAEALRNTSSVYGEGSMPVTYSQCGAKASKNRGGRCELDALTLSNLEKEVALLSEQTQQHMSGDVKVDTDRREENLSFVQRVRRRLSFQQKSSSKDKVKSKTGSSSAASASKSCKQSSRKPSAPK